MTPYDPTDTTPGLLAAIAHLGATVQQQRADLDILNTAVASASAAARDARKEADALADEQFRLCAYIAELELHLRTRGCPADIEAAAVAAQARWATMQMEDARNDAANF